MVNTSRRIASWIVVLAAGVASAGAQQAPAAKKSFEVASVKTAGPLDPQKLLSGQQRVGMKQDAARVDIESLALADIINLAFKTKPYQVSGPNWLGGPANAMTAQRFDVHATLPAGATKDDVPEMLQSLLVERFKLAFHREQKEQSVFALVVGKNGPKLQASAPDTPPPADAPAPAGSNRPDAVQVSGNPQSGMTVRGAGAPAGGPADPGGTSVFQSVENLGLKLDSRKAPIEYLVIDHLEKTPTED